MNYVDIKNEKLLKIPRPANAFMLYANANRKKMAELFPRDSNKDISKRLGRSWKNLEESEKFKFFEKARDIGVEHKKRFPNYVYNPKEARMRKAMREATRDRSLGGLHVQNRETRHTQSWPNPSDEQLMMNPPSELHPSVCGYSSVNGPYAQQLRPYTKTLSALPSGNWTPSSSFYNPGISTESLQQQAEMWHTYQEGSCTATSYLPESQIHPYTSSTTDIISASTSRGNCQSEKETFSNGFEMQSSHVNENVSINVIEPKMPPPNLEKKETNLPLTAGQSSVCCENGESSQQYAQIFNGAHPVSSDASKQNDFVRQKDSNMDEELITLKSSVIFEVPFYENSEAVNFDTSNFDDIIIKNAQLPFLQIEENIDQESESKECSIDLFCALDNTQKSKYDMFLDYLNNFENIGSEVDINTSKIRKGRKNNTSKVQGK